MAHKHTHIRLTERGRPGGGRTGSPCLVWTSPSPCSATRG